ncbi:unnamed protein product [Urochloa decumbens]|uniref:DUF4220 domain-containing protein n=1 Tax=Urochloa decumbens TaxID=240449 RepID=A0ABC9DA80_9POAL
MRPLKINGDKVDRGDLMGKNSLVPAVQELWNAWEIHSLILISLFLQVFLFIFAGKRRCNSSSVLSIVLWVAYLSADSVAIFVLGHLAVRASEPGHHGIMSFWAPFVLVHLGGQDTITALSKQDNELWLRHLLSLISQVLVAAYVVAKVSWRDGWLTAAMVLVFINGCIKYAERTYCLYRASPAKLRSDALGSLPRMLQKIQDTKDTKRAFFGFGTTRNERRAEAMRRALDKVSEEGSTGLVLFDNSFRDILSVDAPLNGSHIVSFAEKQLPGMLDKFRSSEGRHLVYEHVGAVLADFYLDLYTKNPLRRGSSSFKDYFDFLRECVCVGGPGTRLICCALCCVGSVLRPYLLYDILRYFSTPVALVLFWFAEKQQGGSSTADIVVSYTLLAGALLLEASSFIASIVARYGSIQLPAWCSKKERKTKKQWSEEIAQYSMMRRYVNVHDAACSESIQRWIGRLLQSRACKRIPHLGAWGIGLLDLTHTPIAHTPIKESILDTLLCHGAAKQWGIASSRGRLALKSLIGWPTTKKALKNTTSSGFDFPASVLIWHIATHICYYFQEEDGGGTSSGASQEQLNKDKQISREMSNYVTYLVFKCGVMLTTHSQLVHKKAHDEISVILSGQLRDSEEQAVKKLFQADKKPHGGLLRGHYTVEIKDSQAPAAVADDDDPARNHIKRLQKRANVLDSPVLPRARAVAQELIGIEKQGERWHHIAGVWSEMLFYAAPRCGAAFHYEHLSTGGELATHVLLLMKFLGPFLPPPDV